MGKGLAKGENVHSTKKVLFTLAVALVAFNEAEQEGTPLEVTPVDPAERVRG